MGRSSIYIPDSGGNMEIGEGVTGADDNRILFTVPT